MTMTEQCLIRSRVLATAALALTALLTGCASDPSTARSRTVGAVIDDQVISHSVSNNIADANAALKDARIDASSFKGAVLLVGQVPRGDLRTQAAQVAANTPDVSRVYNELTIGPNASFAVRASDNLITTKVKSQLWAEETIKDSKITVITELGVVYLRGMISREQASLASKVAARIDGVQKVVQLFDIIDAK